MNGISWQPAIKTLEDDLEKVSPPKCGFRQRFSNIQRHRIYMKHETQADIKFVGVT